MNTRSEIEQKILNSYSKLRQEHERNANLAIERARRHPEFDKLYTEIKDYEYKIGECEANGGDSAPLKTMLTKLRTRLKQTIKKLGLIESDFTPKVNCPKCKDTGFIGHTQCSCFRSKVNEELVKSSGLEAAKLNTFDDFNENVSDSIEHREVLKKLKSQLMIFTDKFPDTKVCNVLLSGPTGVGKTFALECTTSEILKKGYTANFLTAFQLNNQFIKYHGCFDANKQSYLNICLDPDLLVIDDLGTEPMFNNVTKEYLYLVISERMLKHKFTLISTNLTPSNILDRYGERIFSRLFDKSKSILIRIDGSDLRRLKRS